MKPPRRWVVWLVVIGVGVGVARAAQARSTLSYLLPYAPREEQSGEPEPGPVPVSLRCRLELVRLAIAGRVTLRILLSITRPLRHPVDVQFTPGVRQKGGER